MRARRLDPPTEPVGLIAKMRRVVHYRFEGLLEQDLERLHAQFESLAEARTWRCNPPWIASVYSRGLFEMEYFRHLRNEEPSAGAAGFVKMAGDETDALIIAIFIRDLSAEYGINASMRDDDHPLAKLRRLVFTTGRLPNAQELEDVHAKRHVSKDVISSPTFFFTPP